MSISGGTERSFYRLSLRYLYDDSTLQYGNNNNNRYNFRLNNTFKLVDNLTLESSISYSRQEQVAPSMIGSVLTVSVPMPGLPLASLNGKSYAWGTWGSPVAKVSEGGDNRLSGSTFNVSETLSWVATDWLTASVNLGYNTNIASRNQTENAITYYNYVGDTQVLVDPTQENSYYKQTSSQTDFYSATGF